MPVRAVRIAPQGTIEVVHYDGLDELQALVGGNVEVVQLNIGDQIAAGYFDEDGKAKGLPLNAIATRYTVGLAKGDYIAGPMVVIGNETGPDGEDTNIDGQVMLDLVLSHQYEV